MHSLAWGALKPLAGAETVANKKQLESTADIMGHSLVYWVQECLLAGLFDKGARIFAMTSCGRHARHPGVRAGERRQGDPRSPHPATGAGTGAGRASPPTRFWPGSPTRPRCASSRGTRS